MRAAIFLVCLMLIFAGHSEQASLKKAIKLPSLTRGTNGGSACMVCTVVVSLTEQLALVYNQTIEQSLTQLCNFLPSGLFRTTCNEAVTLFGPIIINGWANWWAAYFSLNEMNIFLRLNKRLYTKKTPDVICHALRFCKTDPGRTECVLFPKPKVEKSILINF